jgi:hypothetical protein
MTIRHCPPLGHLHQPDEPTGVRINGRLKPLARPRERNRRMTFRHRPALGHLRQPDALTALNADGRLNIPLSPTRANEAAA